MIDTGGMKRSHIDCQNDVEGKLSRHHTRQRFSVTAAIAYSAEVDRPFRANVTGHSAEFAVEGFSTLVGHDQSRFHGLSRFATGLVA
jgi:hypothetical protein